MNGEGIARLSSPTAVDEAAAATVFIVLFYFLLFFMIRSRIIRCRLTVFSTIAQAVSR